MPLGIPGWALKAHFGDLNRKRLLFYAEEDLLNIFVIYTGKKW
jgi:hypothetical protein